VLPKVKAGKLRGLAVTGLKRNTLAPDIPSVAELGYPQLESLAWIGLLVTAGTPPEVVQRLSTEAIKGMHAADAREMLAKQGFDVIGGSAADFSRWIKAASTTRAKVIKASGATAD